MFAQRSFGRSFSALNGVTVAEGAAGGFGSRSIDDRVSSEAGAFEMSWRGPEAGVTALLGLRGVDASGWIIWSGDVR